MYSTYIYLAIVGVRAEQGWVQALTEVLEAQAKHFWICFKYQALFQAFEEKVLKH